MNELKLGARSTMPRKPEVLALLDELKAYNLPLVAGGIIDQPSITSDYLKAARQTVEMMEYIQELSDQRQNKDQVNG